MKLMLASQSLHRVHVLDRAGFLFDQADPIVDEEAHKEKIKHLPVKDQALALAAAKAKMLSVGYPEYMVLGCDQMCALGDDILSKPKSEDEVVNQLVKLSEKTIHLHTALSVWVNGEEVWSVVESPEVVYQKLTQEDAKSLLNESVEQGYSPVGCAGAFRLESPLIQKVVVSVDGDEDTIIGLPLKAFENYLLENMIQIEG